MTVRDWFRLARAEAWAGPRWPEVSIYFRTDTVAVPLHATSHPLTPPVRVCCIQDIQKFLDTGVPMHAIDRVRLSMRDTVLA